MRSNWCSGFELVGGEGARGGEVARGGAGALFDLLDFLCLFVAADIRSFLAIYLMSQNVFK